MLADLDLDTKTMEKYIYVQLLGEGTKVYRPVRASVISDKFYEIEGFDTYDPEDEIWEFTPGTRVVVEEQNLNGKMVLVAVKKIF